MRSFSQATQRITAVSVRSGGVKLLQARRDSKGSVTLLGMKARQVHEASDEESLTRVLREMVESLPEPPGETVGLFSSDAVVTRYLSLPSQDPDELQAMALYQMEGSLPYSIEQCVVSVKPLGPMGEATRVLVVVAHRPDIERLIRICQRANLRLTSVASATEAVGRWHQACWPEGALDAAAWLAVEVSEDEIDLGVFLNGSLSYMRHVSHVGGDLQDLAACLEETIQAYEKERVGPKIARVTISGRLDRMAPGALERLEVLLGLAVHRVDPLERSPFKDALAVTAKEIAPEISFSDLLGVVCVPRLLGLDLLPLETRVEQARQSVFRQGRWLLALLALTMTVLAVWVGLRMACVFLATRQAHAEVLTLQAQLTRVQRKAETIQAIGTARDLYARQIRWIGSAVQHLPPGVTLQFLGMEGEGVVVLRAVAPDLTMITAYSAALRGDLLWATVALRAARVQTEQGKVEFEMALSPKQ